MEFPHKLLVDKEHYLLACASYVELNPVRVNMVKDPKDYKWSSYNVYAFRIVTKKSNLVDEHASYKDLGKDDIRIREKYREFVKRIFKERDGIRGEMDKKTIYGDKNFSEYIKSTYKE